MSNAHRQARMEAAASSEYRYMDNATFDLRSAALGFLDATEALELAPPEVSHIPLGNAQFDAREALYAAFDAHGMDRYLLARLGLTL